MLSDCAGNLAKFLDKHKSEIKDDSNLTFEEKMKVLKQIYLRFMCDDPLDGSWKDCKFLDTMDKMVEKVNSPVKETDSLPKNINTDSEEIPKGYIKLEDRPGDEIYINTNNISFVGKNSKQVLKDLNVIGTSGGNLTTIKTIPEILKMIKNCPK